MTSPQILLVLNAGSSSLKFALYDATGPEPARLLGETENWSDGSAALRSAMAQADAMGALAGVGHRVVHGGAEFFAPTLLTPRVVERLQSLVHLAPLQQPQGLHVIAEAMALRPGLPQIACFDTSFHHGHSPVVDRLPLPRDIAEGRGLRRYGFHGLAYEHLVARLGQLDPSLARGRVLMAHLGAGASLCAVRDGRSIDTTMGFSTLDGLVMATRCGALDPGVVLHLMQAEGMSVEAVQDLLYRRSGLLGLSGLSGDMRDLLASDRPEAGEAIEGYVLQIVRQAGAMAAVMGGLDGVVFSGGVGENAAPIRALICERLGWLGVELDAEANAARQPRISKPASRPVWVIPADEEGVIARRANGLLRTSKIQT